MIIFDEASAIDSIIWEVTEGALTDEHTQIIWLAFGNPTRSEGRFHDCFYKNRLGWKTWNIDGRNVAMTNKAQLASMVERYGEDSDIVKVRVRGIFPSASVSQLIPSEWVDQAMRRTLRADDVKGAPVLLGLDVARFGDDKSPLWYRKGLHSDRLFSATHQDTMQLASLSANAILEHKPQAFFIDISGGLGAGTYDRLKQMGFGNILIPVNFGASATKKNQYVNKRAEMYGEMKEWLKNGGALPPSGEASELIAEDLAATDYFIDRNGRIGLEAKEDIKAKLGRSPDDGDGLALTFAEPVIAPDTVGYDAYSSAPQSANGDYDPFAA